ncbi:MAG: FtsX-like permease family protein, partial [Planctomycetes bacterium]|nr:FtsX-like permease family protein [Planctomycetota bacterium]
MSQGSRDNSDPQSRFRLVKAWALAVLIAVSIGDSRGDEPNKEAPGEATGLGIDYEALLKALDATEIRRDVAFLSSFASRALGYEGADRAADYVAGRMKALGYSVRVEQFPEVMPIDRGGRLEFKKSGEKIPIHAFWPNLSRTPSTGPDGITGRLLYARDGDYRWYDDRRVNECIVILDFNSTNNYLKAFMLGARAVIFLEPDRPERKEAEAKLLAVPVYAPKYYVKKEYVPKLLELAKQRALATLHCRMTWERVTGTNLIAQVEGSEEALADDGALLAAYFDAMSVVPAVCPGADQACGIAVWLQMARMLKQRPPARPVTLLATNAHFMNNAGVKNFLRCHPRSVEDLDAKFYKSVLREGGKWAKAREEKGGLPALWPPAIAQYEEPDFLRHRFAVCLDLSSHSSRVGVFVNGVRGLEELNQLRVVMPINNALREHAEAALGEEASRLFYSGISGTGGVTWDSMLPADLAFDSRAFLDLRREAVAMATTSDLRLAVDTPLDRPEFVDLEGLTAQARVIAQALGGLLLDKRRLPQERISMVQLLDWARTRALYLDPKKMTYTGIAEQPVPNALVMLKDFDAQKATPGQDAKTECALGHTGVRAWCHTLTNEDGWACLVFDGPDPQMQKDAYLIEPDGRLTMSIDFGIFGIGRVGGTGGVSASTPTVLFPFKQLEVFETLDVREMGYVGGIELLDQNDGFPQRWGGLGNGRVAMISLDPMWRLKLIAGGSGEFALLLLNTSQEHPTGTGFGPQPEGCIPTSFFQAVQDQECLVQFRRDRLRQCGIRYPFIDDMVDKAAASLKEALDHLKQHKYSLAMRRLFDANTRAGTAYPLIWNVMTDTIYGLILVFMLVVPFSIFLERLLFGIIVLQRRLLAVLGIFVCLCLILSALHPGFDVATSPYLIPLGFVILSLVLIVLTMMLSKFDQQVAALHDVAARVHHQDVNRVGAAWAAFSLGIGNMRRRKTRTALTLVTLVLITFSLLSLTSGEISRKHFRVALQHKPSYPGALVREREWKSFSEAAPEVLSASFSHEAQLAPRCWLYRRTEQPLMIPVECNGRRAYVYGLVGLTPDETAVTGLHREVEGQRWFTAGAGPQCMLPAPLAQELGLEDADIDRAQVRINGRDFRLAGLYQPGRLQEFQDLDGEPVSPLLPIRAQASTTAGLMQFVHLDLKDVALTTYDDLRNMGAPIVSVAMRFHNPTLGEDFIRDFASRTNVLCFVALDERVEAWSYLGFVWVSGLRALLIPLLIGGLIILNTMLNSVYERAREIGIFGSVGLSPIHISALFFAESLVYGVLGVMFGYLVGQVAANVIIYFDLATGLSLNYSS